MPAVACLNWPPASHSPHQAVLMNGLQPDPSQSYLSNVAQWQAYMHNYMKDVQAQAPVSPFPPTNYPSMWAAQGALPFGQLPFGYPNMLAAPYMVPPAVQASQHPNGLPDYPSSALLTPKQEPTNSDRPSESKKHKQEQEHLLQCSSSADTLRPGTRKEQQQQLENLQACHAEPKSGQEKLQMGPVTGPSRRHSTGTSTPVSTAGSSDQQETMPGEKDSKKLRRKQSNRESARRSRLRKQAETEMLSKSVKELCDENTELRQTIEKLSAQVEQLKSAKVLLIDQVLQLGGVLDPAIRQDPQPQPEQMQVALQHALQSTQQGLG